MKKQLLLFIMILLPITASADSSGKCGENLQWNYVESTKTLTISGSGDMSSSYIDWGGILNSVENLIIEEGVTSIPYQGFYFMENLKTLKLASSLTDIGGYAFDSCQKLVSIDIPNGMTSLSVGMFANCTALNEVSLPGSLLTINNTAFNNCSALTKVQLHDGTQVIDDYAFFQCSSLQSIEFVNSINTIGACAFRKCSSLVEIVIPDNVTTLGQAAFTECSGVKSLQLGKGLKVIENSTFSRCTGLASVTVPDNVTTLKKYAFGKNPNLTIAIIGKGITDIDLNAFGECNAYRDAYLYAEKIPNVEYDSYALSFIHNHMTLHVPSALINDYKSTSPWNMFKSIVAIEGEGSPQCEVPTISYSNGKLTFYCKTEGAVCNSTITNTDINSYTDNEISLSVTYNISVYASKIGLLNSETATATLCWIDQTPKTEGITNGVANIPANAVLIKSNEGSLNIQGLDEGTQISVYAIDGKLAGSATSQQGETNINTSLRPGSIAVVKMGDKSVKVVVK